MEFSDLLINWYLKNKRDLPWRKINDPYRIWISEIILQQTRVAQGLDYYNNFIAHFPDVRSLAEADESEVLKCWQGLGYYSRARNLHFSAKTILEKHGGIFPQNHAEVRALKGVGDYTAAAICSFAYGLPYAAVDGNAYRVLSRVFEMDTPIDSAKGKSEFFALAQELLDKKRSALFNQAMMDLGAVVCTPVAPECVHCPMQDVCLALAHGRVGELPVKSKKVATRDRYFYYFFIETGGYIYLHKRESDDIWKGLYELPLVETPCPMEADVLLDFAQNTLFGKNFPSPQVDKIHSAVTHVLSHLRIHATLIEARAAFLGDASSEYIKVLKSDFDNYPISRLTEILLTQR
ncbi:MAG: A/G-specific adenine glycosylase [Paludibacteraceae bacterium]|nr:A/G-specific adenine glycosylase [Paludibacteraceae bacterium]